MTLKDPLDYLGGAATFSCNRGVRLLSAILIRGDLLKDLLLKFARTFGFSARIRNVNNVAVNYKGIYSRISATIKGFFD